MNVDRVTATVKFSKDTGQGWKTIELGAEAGLEADDDWQLSQQGLYSLLTSQLHTLWGKNGIAEHAAEAPEKAVEPPPTYEASSVLHGHYCQQHQTEFRQHEKDGKTWYSHRTPDGWCNER